MLRRPFLCREISLKVCFAIVVVSLSALCVPAAAAGAKRGFVDRVFKDAAGDHKYTVFVPRNYSPEKKWPLILYLHGAGERGNDGRLPLTVGIGPAVKSKAETFGFLVVFPQCEDVKGRILTGWSPESADGKRALKILDAVEKEFSVDSKRRVLTGWSSSTARTSSAKWTSSTTSAIGRSSSASNSE